ncbi:MAG: MFS transporter [Pseudomonadota bacterium]
MIRFVIGNSRWLSAGLALTFTSSFGQTFFISIFAAEIMAHYDLTDGEWGTAYATGTMISGFLMIWAGSLSDYVKVKWLAVMLLGSLACFCAAMAGNASVALLPFIIFGLRFCGQGMLHHTAMVGMARWFGLNRGKAVSIAGLGFSIGEAFLPMLVVALLVFFPWTTLWLGVVGMALLFIPLILWQLSQERRPADAANETTSLGLGGRHWTRLDVIKNWMFWALFPLVIGPSIYGTVLFFQQVHLAEVKGWDHSDLVVLFPLYTATTVVAMLIYGVLIDRFGASRLIPFAQLPAAIGFLILSSTTNFAGAALSFFFIALMQGGWSTLGVSFWAEMYGTRYLGSIKAAATAIMVLGSAVGPAITGVLIDRGATFPEQMPGISLMIVFASALAAYTIYRARLRYT